VAAKTVIGGEAHQRIKFKTRHDQCDFVQINDEVAITVLTVRLRPSSMFSPKPSPIFLPKMEKVEPVTTFTSQPNGGADQPERYVKRNARLSGIVIHQAVEGELKAHSQSPFSSTSSGLGR
jgi:hypothetical protein